MKRFERSNGLDTALYKKNYLLLDKKCIITFLELQKI